MISFEGMCELLHIGFRARIIGTNADTTGDELRQYASQRREIPRRRARVGQFIGLIA
jgi:hypothetical protein